MDGSSSVPIALSTGALITAAVVSWYLNGRITELEEHSESLKTNISTLVLKYTNDIQKVDDIAPFRSAVEHTLMNIRKDIDTLKETQVKLINMNKLQGQAITELQEFMTAHIDEDYQFQHTMPSTRVPKKKKKKRSRKASSSEDDSESTNQGSSDDEKSDDIEKQMKRVKSK